MTAIQFAGNKNRPRSEARPGTHQPYDRQQSKRVLQAAIQNTGGASVKQRLNTQG